MTGVPEDTLSKSSALSGRAALVVAITCLVLGGIAALDVRLVSVTHGQGLSWSVVLWTSMPRWIVLAATLPLALAIGLDESLAVHRTRVVILHVALYIAISLLQSLASAWATGFTSPIVYLIPWTARIVRALYNTTPTMLSLYVAVVIAGWGMREARERERRTLRASQLETQLQAARLEALRAKLQPHFLYNTLNGIAALIADLQPTRAVAAIENLSELLHVSLRDDARETIALDEEMDLTSRYLALQRMRFGDRVHCELRLAPEVRSVLVPVLLLQPIIENAVVHGLEAGVERLHILVHASVASEGVELVVENDGTSLDRQGAPTAVGGHGLGLATTRARLRTMYGDRASLHMVSRAGGGVRVRIVLPGSAVAAAIPTLPSRAMAS